MANDILDLITVISNLIRWNIAPIYEELSNPQTIDYIRLFTAVFAGASSAGFLVVYFKEKIRQVPLLFCRNHIILCGQNDAVISLVKELTLSKKKSVVITTASGKAEIPDIRQYATIVLNGNAKDPAVLSHARIRSAGALLALTDSDGYNAEIVLSAMDVLKEREGDPMPCIIEIHHPALWRIIREEVLVRDKKCPVRLDFYNGPAIAARVLVSTFFSPHLNTWLDTPSLLIIVGAGKLGEKIITQASREWFEHGHPGKGKLEIALIDLHAGTIKDQLNSTYPLLKDTAGITPISVDVQSPAFQASGEITKLRDFRKVLAFVCLNDDTAGLSAALALSHHFTGIETTILVRMDHNPGLAKLVGEKGSGSLNITPFSSLAIASQSNLVIGGIRELLARTIHAEYLATRSKEDHGMGTIDSHDSSLATWENLPEKFKESNRKQAESILEKLAAVGCDIMPLVDWSATNFQFSRDEIENLAEMEHTRWMDEMLLEGYSFGPEKDEKQKIHPCMIPYSKLPEHEKEKDRNTVRMIPVFLGLIDFQVYRVSHKTGESPENHGS